MTQAKQTKSTVAKDLERLRQAGQVRVLGEAEIAERLQGVSIPKRADAVFEGGGVKGIAFAGATAVAEQLGVNWACLAGTSAGAITASLLAAGYTGKELIPTLTEEMDFKAFMDEGLLDKVPLFGKLASAMFEKGIYEGDYFEEWMEEKLADKGVATFGDLKDAEGKYRLKVIASDVTQRRMMILPDDLPAYGRDPDSFPVARAARMSMSIPYFFEPVELDIRNPGKRGRRKCYVVDGGMLSNYPVWLFDTTAGHVPRWPTYGFKLIEPESEQPSPSNLPHQYLMSLISTMMDAHDKTYVDVADFERTVGIPTLGVSATDFDLSDATKTLLLRAGQEAAIHFFKDKWDFDRHNREFRSSEG